MEQNIDTLQELVNCACDHLYAERQLITIQAVKKIVLLHENWIADTSKLDQQLPGCVNAWRLDNIQADTELSKELSVSLSAQLCKYKADLLVAERIIEQLKVELQSKDNAIKMLRIGIMNNLRGLLHG